MSSDGMEATEAEMEESFGGDDDESGTGDDLHDA